MTHINTKLQNFKKIFLATLLSFLVFNSTNAQSIDLFISEYSEGSSYNKYIEIYNGTGTPVDLGVYELWKITNGGDWPEQILPLSGILLDGDVYVIAHGSADPSILIETDLITTSSALNFNGDDAIGLAFGGMLLDMVGMDGPDPGTGWDVAGVSNATKDHTLVRKCSVNHGNLDWVASTGLDSLSSEWIVNPINDWSNIGQHTYPCQSSSVNGCADPTAFNYDASATVDDGSCITSCLTPTNLQLQTTYHDRAWVQWDETSSIADSVVFYKIRYRAVGDTSWLLKQKTYEGNQTGITKTRLLSLTGNTQYEMKIKAEYQSGCISDFGPISYFTTLPECPNVGNLAVTTPTTTKATFTWDDSNGSYSFVRIKFRVDSISNPTGADWQNAGGFGVMHPAFTKNKNNLTPGQSYRGQSRTWCDPNGGPYKASGWTPLMWWTQPINRMEGGESIAHLAIYPNPSRNIFNVTFQSEEVQDLKVRIINIIGEELLSEDLQQFIGEYVKSINLKKYTKGVYFLEIETSHGVVNKKLILQ